MSNEGHEKAESVMHNKKSFFKTIFEKAKTIKHLDIILTVLFIAIILLIYFSTFSNSSGTSKNYESSKSEVVEYTNDKSADLMAIYTNEVETKLIDVLSNLKNVGKVNVAVKFSGGIEYVYAYSTKVETLDDGTKVETKTPIFKSQDGSSTPIILQTKMPDIESVVVISSGARNTEVKLDILRVVQLLYNIPSSKIEIFVGN